MGRRQIWQRAVLRTLLKLFAMLAVVDAFETSLSQLHDQPRYLRPRNVKQKDRKFFKFVTRPDIDAISWDLKIHDEQALSPGYWFLAPYQELDQGTPGDAWVGPHIYDGNGELIWSGAAIFQHWNAFDFDLTTIQGQQMMTILFPHGKAGLILDHNYRVWKHVPLDSIKADMHAFRVIDEGRRALVITHDHVDTTVEEAEIVGYNGSCSVAYIGFAELDVQHPSSPVFMWNAYHHIGLEEGTYNTDRLDHECTHNWDLLHVNAIDKFDDGDYLISSRHSDTLYKVSHVDGSIVWRLGGVKSDFIFVGPGNSTFSRQHHALVHSQRETRTTISLFDNAVGTGPNEHETNKVARGLLLSLDTLKMTASIVAEYENPKGHTVSSRGSFQLLKNGNAFMCWTYSSYISEHSANGSVLMEAILPVSAHSYRAFKYPWIGKPTQPPDVVSEAISTKNNNTHTMVYVSWNGATEVDRWALYRAYANGVIDQAPVVLWPRQGFETAITFKNATEYIVVEGVAESGEPLGRSELIRTIPLEEQGLNQLTYLDQNRPMLEHYDSPSLAHTVVNSSVGPFALGFATCGILGMVLAASSRRNEGRIWGGRGPKYELLMQEHIP